MTCGKEDFAVVVVLVVLVLVAGNSTRQCPTLLLLALDATALADLNPIDLRGGQSSPLRANSSFIDPRRLSPAVI